MAEAVKDLWPDVKVTIGPAIDNGFYYDFDKKEPFSDEDLRKIEKAMRRRNLISAAAMPHKTALTYTYDCGDVGKNLADCLQLADYAGFAARRAESEQHGKLRGIGISSTVEASNAGLIEHAEMPLLPTRPGAEGMTLGE